MRKALLLIALVLVFPLIAFSRDKLPELRVGMSQGEVLTRAGSPVSREIREVKREEVWYFNGYSVLFHEGAVAGLTGLGPQSTPVPETEKRQEYPQARVRKTSPADLMRTILKELPAPAGTPGAGGPPPPQQLAPGIPQPGMPQPPSADFEQ